MVGGGYWGMGYGTAWGMPTYFPILDPLISGYELWSTKFDPEIFESQFGSIWSLFMAEMCINA